MYCDGLIKAVESATMLSRTLFRRAHIASQSARCTRTLATTSVPSPPQAASSDVSTSTQGAKAPSSPEHLSQLNETDQIKPWLQRLKDVGQDSRLPRSVQALYLRPLRRKAQYGLPVCDLQLRSYSVRNVEFFADFAIRAAYYLNLPVSGPIPLPRMVQRWTVTRSNFVHKKSQENFERITLRRLIQIKDGHPETVQLWLAFLRRHAFYGVGMKANVYDFDDIDVASGLDTAAEDVTKTLEPYFAQFGQRQGAKTRTSIADQVNSERFSNPRGPMNKARRG